MLAPREIELKLDLPLDALRKLKRSLLLDGNHVPGKSVDATSVYFDAGKLNLHKKGISLRVRQVDGRFLQTVKCNEPANGAALSRDEWEIEINGKDLDLDAARRTALEPLLTKKVCRALKPIFETRVHRTVYPILYDGSEIEVASTKDK